MQNVDFSPTKTLEELLPQYQAQSKDNVPSSQNEVKPSTKKQQKAKGYSSSALLGLHTKQEKDEEEAMDDTYMIGKENIATPIDIAVLMPLVKEYTKTHWHKHHGLMAVIKQQPPTYQEQSYTLFFNIYNNSQQQLIQQKSDKLLKHLRTQLNNYQLKIDFTILAEGSNGPKGPKTMLKEMVNKNPHLQDLIDTLALELEF